MHIGNLKQWQHDHHFHLDNSAGERGTRRVILLTLVMMVVEIGAGMTFGSMALLADGWHMGTQFTRSLFACDGGCSYFAAGDFRAFDRKVARLGLDGPAYGYRWCSADHTLVLGIVT